LEVSMVLGLLKMGNAFLPGSAPRSSGGCSNPSHAGDGEFQSSEPRCWPVTDYFSKSDVRKVVRSRGGESIPSVSQWEFGARSF
jgi:hypothetical protein